jgi:hypothetical protein
MIWNWYQLSLLGLFDSKPETSATQSATGMAYRQLKAMPRGRTRQILHDARRFAGSLRQAQRQAGNRQCGDPS